MVNVAALPDTTAPLRNVGLLNQLVVRLVDRKQGEDNFGAFYGPSGYGKSCAAVYCRNKSRGVLLRVGSTWTGKHLAEQIAGRLGVRDIKRTTPKIVDQIVSVLLDNPSRPLILDEADFLVKKSIIEILRDISDNSKIPVILIGEETLKARLAVWERIYGRVLAWVEAVPCDLADARHLARLYASDITLDDDLLARIRDQAEGRARRIVRHLGRALEISRQRGIQSLALHHWDGETDGGNA